MVPRPAGLDWAGAQPRCQQLVAAGNYQLNCDGIFFEFVAATADTGFVVFVT